MYRTSLRSLHLLAELTAQNIFFSKCGEFDGFESSRIFFEYLCQFPPVSNENKNMGLALKICIDIARPSQLSFNS